MVSNLVYHTLYFFLTGQPYKDYIMLYIGMLYIDQGSSELCIWV